ncbi:MAG: DUF2948 family protein [Alphaproteobacteria bacterium]
MTKTGPVLLAQDEEDLKIVSAQLQDAVAHVGELVFLPRSRRFAALFNRFRWEDCADAKGKNLRVRAGLHFDGVLSAKSYMLRREDPMAVVELLAIQFVPGEEGAGTIELLFAGGGAIRLEVECIDASLRDISGPWPAVGRPKHETTGTGE